MLRLTTTVYQVMSDAHVVVTVHQEDPFGGPSALLGDVKSVYDLAPLLDDYDELTSLLIVLRTWSTQVISRQVHEVLARSAQDDDDGRWRAGQAGGGTAP